MTQTKLPPETVTVHIPFRIVKRGGRKEMLLPTGKLARQKTDGTLVKAVARAFRWKRMLESGRFTTANELAEREGIAPSYLARLSRLTFLAPEIVEAILEPLDSGEPGIIVSIDPTPNEIVDDIRSKLAAL